MTENLLNTGDFARFQAKDQSWFLGAVGETIRDFCHWHIFPVVSVTNVSAKIGGAGIIMLPTLNLVSVEEIRLGGTALTSAVWQPDPAGFIVYQGFVGRRARGCRVSVDMTHGFEELPKVVAEVGYELTATVLEKASGVVTDMTRGPTMFKFKEFGVVLSDDQKARLGPYVASRL